MEGSPADRVKKLLDHYPSATFWDELFGPLRMFLKSKVRMQFSIFSDDDAWETADETICRTHEHCNFDVLSALPEDTRNKTFFKFLKTTLYNSAIDLIRERDGRYTANQETRLVKRLKRPASQLVWRAFEELSFDEQMVISLKDIDGLTYEQVAAYYYEELGEHVGAEALKKRRLRALAQVLRRLKELLNDEGA